jgi:hypothetical protein
VLLFWRERETEGLRRLKELWRGSMTCLLKDRYFKWTVRIIKIVNGQFWRNCRGSRSVCTIWPLSSQEKLYFLSSREPELNHACLFKSYLMSHIIYLTKCWNKIKRSWPKTYTYIQLLDHPWTVLADYN